MFARDLAVVITDSPPMLASIMERLWLIFSIPATAAISIGLWLVAALFANSSLFSDNIPSAILRALAVPLSFGGSTPIKNALIFAIVCLVLTTVRLSHLRNPCDLSQVCIAARLFSSRILPRAAIPGALWPPRRIRRGIVVVPPQVGFPLVPRARAFPLPLLPAVRWDHPPFEPWRILPLHLCDGSVCTGFLTDLCYYQEDISSKRVQQLHGLAPPPRPQQGHCSDWLAGRR